MPEFKNFALEAGVEKGIMVQNPKEFVRKFKSYTAMLTLFIFRNDLTLPASVTVIAKQL